VNGLLLVMVSLLLVNCCDGTFIKRNITVSYIAFWELSFVTVNCNYLTYISTTRLYVVVLAAWYGQYVP
jgi:hypothetical protein